MKKKVSHQSFGESDKFDRKQKNHTRSKDKSFKNKLSVYDEFEDEDLINYSSESDETED